MSINRLFIYDPKTETAVCIAKGYTTGWATYGDGKYQNEFFDLAAEPIEDMEGEGGREITRYELHCEGTLPKCKRVIFASKAE